MGLAKIAVISGRFLNWVQTAAMVGDIRYETISFTYSDILEWLRVIFETDDTLI